MFEDALMESGGKLRTCRAWFSGVAAICNSFFLCLLVLWPLLHPASLPKQILSTLLAAPVPPALSVAYRVPSVSVAPHPEVLLNAFTAPRAIPDHVVSEHESFQRDFGPTSLGGGVPGSLNGLPDSLGASATPPVRIVPQKRPAVSSGVMEGRKLSGINPRYPAMAIAAHVQGTVMLAATISKTGTIENLRRVSGSPMLAPAAEEAVRTWRYRPYLLNGEPVEVETTVNVVFRLGD
jgi:periplasmic protein TonB